MLTLMLAALDQNIVATALPRIVSDVGGLAHLSWVVTAFLLASTVTTPLYGKLSDLYGRRPLFIVAILVFLVGSALCGMAQTMTQLIVFRGVQGLGAGGLISLAQAAIGDLVSPRERGRYQGLFTGVFAICSVAGPLLGGYLTDALSWRWIFYVNLPVGAAALGLIAVGLPRRSRLVAHRIDYLGAALLSSATICLLLLLSWGGNMLPWTSPAMLCLALTAMALIAVLAGQEQLAAEPILPVQLFTNRVFVVAVAAIALTATALFASTVFLPAFFQLVLNASPSESGLMIAPLMAGLIVSSIAGGRLVVATGRYKVLPVIGLAVASVAFLALAWTATADVDRPPIEAALVVLGAALGLIMPNLTVAIQNAVERMYLGIATSSASFFRSLGGAVGVAAAGAIVSANLADLSASLGVAQQSIQDIAGLPPAGHAAFIAAYRHAMGVTFLAATGVTALAFIIVIMLPEHPLGSGRQADVDQ
jgi:EmrB/QacA subfamily drug resistance transporter